MGDMFFKASIRDMPFCLGVLGDEMFFLLHKATK